jgi:hypothetical protein
MKRFEVVDWGGSGGPLILLAGGNNHAHSFDKFAPNSLPCTAVMASAAAGPELRVLLRQRKRITMPIAWATTSWP